MVSILIFSAFFFHSCFLFWLFSCAFLCIFFNLLFCQYFYLFLQLFFRSVFDCFFAFSVIFFLLLLRLFCHFIISLLFGAPPISDETVRSSFEKDLERLK